MPSAATAAPARPIRELRVSQMSPHRVRDHPGERGGGDHEPDPRLRQAVVLLEVDREEGEERRDHGTEQEEQHLDGDGVSDPRARHARPR
jgi:hypothetical protein